MKLSVVSIAVFATLALQACGGGGDHEASEASDCRDRLRAVGVSAAHTEQPLAIADLWTVGTDKVLRWSNGGDPTGKYLTTSGDISGYEFYGACRYSATGSVSVYKDPQ